METTTRRKPYTVITDCRKREDIVIFAQEHSWKEALEKYNISLATLKRWSANYNSDDRHRSLIWHYGHKRREDKYFDQCVIIRKFIDDNYKKSPNKHGMQKWTKAQLVHYIHRSLPQVHISTVYRLIKYVENNNEKFISYL